MGGFLALFLPDRTSVMAATAPAMSARASEPGGSEARGTFVDGNGDGGVGWLCGDESADDRRAL